jgi:hypothetical protein
MIMGVILLGGGMNATAALTLVQDGRATAVIVIADRPAGAVPTAINVLTDALFRMSGAQLAVVRESSLTGATVKDGQLVVPGTNGPSAYILVGELALSQQMGLTSEGLGPGGIRIKTIGNVLGLLGPDEKTPSDAWGSFYAVTTFLDETLGCKYLWPTESGWVVPEQKTIRIPELDIRATPRLRQRVIRSMGLDNRVGLGVTQLGFAQEDFTKLRAVKTPDWFRWHRMGGTLDIRGGDGTILTKEGWERILKEHPEWLAMQADGSREQAPGESRPRLCKSNAALIEAIVKEKLKELADHPGQSSISLMTHDGGQTGMCLCPDCKAMDPTNGRPVKVWTYNHATRGVEWMDYVSLTDRMFSFYNAIAEQVAKAYPDVLFCGQAYSVYSAPPVKTKLHPNILIRYVGISYAKDTLRQEGLKDWDTWTRAASKIYFRPNLLLTGRREGTPAIYVHKMARDFRHLVDSGMIGTDYDACIHNWATLGLNYYILAKLHWTPELDVDDAIREYCQAGFGEGWKDARRYLERLEKLTDRFAATPDMGITEPYTPEMIKKLGGYLDDIERAEKGNVAVQRRVAFLRRGLDFTAVQAQAYRLLAQVKDRPATDAEKAEAAALLDRRWKMMRVLFREEPYAVNVAYMVWGEGGKFAPLGWTGPSPAARGEVEADELGRPVDPTQ